MFKNNPLFFINFLFFSTYHFCFWKAVFCWKHYKNSVFRKKHSFSKTQLAKPTFSPMSKNTFSKKRCHFWFWAISAETTIFIVCPDLHCFGQKKFWPKQIVCTKMRVFSPFLTQIVSGNFCWKSIFFAFFTCLDDHLKKPYFYRVLGPFPFSIFFLFSVSFFQNKRKKQKMQFSFRKPHFDIPQILQKHNFDTVALFVFSKIPKKPLQIGEKQWKKTWTSF